MDKEKIIENLEKAKTIIENWVPMFEQYNTPFGIDCAIALLKEHEVRELTIDEWREWKNDPKRNPICELWEHDTSPMWVLNPDTIHEPALLMGKLKLFTGKPTLEQCKAVKWDG